AFRHAPAHVVRLSGRMILLKLLGHVQDAETHAYMDPNLDSCPRGKRGNESRSVSFHIENGIIPARVPARRLCKRIRTESDDGGSIILRAAVR
ncbi:hypothetical protein ALC57_07436, partial [Trachymyrmex cornetzi]